MFSLLIALLLINTFWTGKVECKNESCSVDGYRKPYESQFRYLECNGSSWTIRNCSSNTVYDEALSICTPAEMMSMVDTSTTFSAIKKDNINKRKVEEKSEKDGLGNTTEIKVAADVESIQASQEVTLKEKNGGDPQSAVLDITTITEYQPQSAKIDKGNHVTSTEKVVNLNNSQVDNLEDSVMITFTEPDISTEDNDVEITTKEPYKINENPDDLPEEVLKSIANSGGNFKFQTFEKTPYVWAPEPIIIRKMSKTKANWTTTVLNGVAQFTDFNVYQSHGPSFKFRVPSGLPAEQHKVIAWIRANAHKYAQEEIAYAPDEEQTSQGPPDGLPSRCGTKFLEKLAGGKATPIEENPWQVAVLRSPEESYICGGAVITRRHVLSAAHCFRKRGRNYGPKNIILRLGDYDKEVREESQLDYVVLELKIHEGYHEKRHLNDIALLSTSDDIPFSSNIYPICLPPSYAVYQAGRKCTVSGWGQAESEDVPTRYLRSGEVAIISYEDCRRKTIFARGIPQQIFCAEDPTKMGVDTCLGDSGGPFACRHSGIYYLYGITAFGSYPCGQDIPSFYTNVSFYRTWILKNIKSHALLSL